MKRYVCHKVVEAFKIAEITKPVFIPADDGERILWGEGRDNRESQHVDGAYIGKHKPVIGGYYVRYQDGYESFSPAEAFEDGYNEQKED